MQTESFLAKQWDKFLRKRPCNRFFAIVVDPCYIPFLSNCRLPYLCFSNPSIVVHETTPTFRSVQSFERTNAIALHIFIAVWRGLKIFLHQAFILQYYNISLNPWIHPLNSKSPNLICVYIVFAREGYYPHVEEDKNKKYSSYSVGSTIYRGTMWPVSQPCTCFCLFANKH